MAVVVLGAGGKLGRLLRPIFPVEAQWLTRADADIDDGDALRTALTGASAVMCLAGVTNGGRDPMQANVDVAQRTLDAARDIGAGRVLLFSSAAVYGDASRTAGALRETGPVYPLSPYGHAKLAMEQMASDHAHPNTVLRLGNVAGADAILAGWRAGFALDTLEDGTTPRRSYIGPTTLARVLGDLIASPDLPGLLNVAAPGDVEMGALLDAAGLAWGRRAANGETIAQVTLDTSRICRFTGFQDSDSTPAGLVAQWNGTQVT